MNDTAVTRIGLFVLVLVLVAGAGWGLGRVVNPPLPVPDLPTPSVFQPAESHGDTNGDTHGAGS